VLILLYIVVKYILDLKGLLLLLFSFLYLLRFSSIFSISNRILGFFFIINKEYLIILIGNSFV
jgi:hypothetical protein